MNKERLLEVADDLETGRLPQDVAFDMNFTFLSKYEMKWFASEVQKKMESALHGCRSCCCIAGLIALKWGGLDPIHSDGTLELAAELVDCDYGKIHGLFLPDTIPANNWSIITTKMAATAVKAFVATGEGATCWDAVSAELSGRMKWVMR